MGQRRQESVFLHDSTHIHKKVPGICIQGKLSHDLGHAVRLCSYASLVTSLRGSPSCGGAAASRPLRTGIRGSRGSREGELGGGKPRCSPGSFPRRCPLSAMFPAARVRSAIVAIHHCVSHFHNFLPIFSNWHGSPFPLPLYKTQPQKGYYKITFSVHWLASSVQDEIINFDEFEKFQL